MHLRTSQSSCMLRAHLAPSHVPGFRAMDLYALTLEASTSNITPRISQLRSSRTEHLNSGREQKEPIRNQVRPCPKASAGTGPEVRYAIRSLLRMLLRRKSASFLPRLSPTGANRSKTPSGFNLSIGACVEGSVCASGTP